MPSKLGIKPPIPPPIGTEGVEPVSPTSPLTPGNFVALILATLAKPDAIIPAEAIAPNTAPYPVGGGANAEVAEA